MPIPAAARYRPDGLPSPQIAVTAGTVARYPDRHATFVGSNGARDGNRRGAYGQCAAGQQRRMRVVPAMPKLKAYAAALRVHTVGHAPPARDLLLREDPGGVGEADAIR